MTTPKKHEHLCLLARITLQLCSRNVTDRIGFQSSVYSKLIGQGCTEKYHMADIIPYNPEQSGRVWKTIQEILIDNRPIKSENSGLRCDKTKYSPLCKSIIVLLYGTIIWINIYTGILYSCLPQIFTCNLT